MKKVYESYKKYCTVYSKEKCFKFMHSITSKCLHIFCFIQPIFIKNKFEYSINIENGQNSNACTSLRIKNVNVLLNGKK